MCYSPDGSMTGNEFLNAIVPVDIRVIGVASACLGDGCLADERWDCYVSYFGEDISNCLVDFRAFGGGREGFFVESASSSKSAWTAAWGRDTFLFGELIPASRKRCSDVVTAEYIAPEMAIFDDFDWAPPTGMGFITDAFTAMEMPRLRRTAATDSFTLSMCYCPSYDGPVDPTNDPCDHVPWHLLSYHQIGISQKWDPCTYYQWNILLVLLALGTHTFLQTFMAKLWCCILRTDMHRTLRGTGLRSGFCLRPASSSCVLGFA